jgi:uncharacterized integral membrane protein
MKNVRLIVSAIVVVLVIIVMLQNTEQVQTQLLFASITMPRAILLASTMLIGFVIGLLVAGRARRKKAS